MKKWVFCPLCNGKTRLQIIETTKMKDFPLFCPKCKKEMLIKVNHYEVKMILKIKQVAYEKVFLRSQFVQDWLCAIALFMKVQIYKTYKRLDEVQIVDVSQVKDGTYQGVVGL